MNESMILCEKCGKIASEDSYFGKYICSHCGWKKDTPRTIARMQFDQFQRDPEGFIIKVVSKYCKYSDI